MGVYVFGGETFGTEVAIVIPNIAYFPYNKNESIIGDRGDAERKG